LKTISFEEMAGAVRQAMEHAALLLDRFQPIAPRLRPEDAGFLQRQFTLLALTACVRYHLFRAIYYYHRLTRNAEDAEARAALVPAKDDFAAAVSAIEPLVGAEDLSLVAPAREWIEEFTAVLAENQTL
jgi:hypothetical protein